MDAKDGLAGSVYDCYFDYRYWHVRYWIGDTGQWLPGRKILLTPQAIEKIDQLIERFWVSLTKTQIAESPGIETYLPVSRQREEALHAHYGWAMYWGSYPSVAARIPSAPKIMPHDEAQEKIEGDPNLRSAREVTGYHIAVTDGDIGHVDDFILDVVEDAIRYLVIDTKNWLPGRKVLIAPSWVKKID